MSRGPSPRP